jgi:hypothetical protein
VTLQRVALTSIVVLVAAWLFIAKAQPRMPDFEVYWRAGARAAAAEPLYRPADADYQFKYFPAFAIIAIPFGMLPLDTAKACGLPCPRRRSSYCCHSAPHCSPSPESRCGF